MDKLRVAVETIDTSPANLTAPQWCTDFQGRPFPEEKWRRFEGLSLTLAGSRRYARAVPCEIRFEPIHFLAFMKVLGPAIRIYCMLLGLALGWIFFRGRLSWGLFVDIRVENLPRLILLTLGTSSCMVALSLYCSRNFAWAEQLEAEFVKFLVPMKLWEIAAIGLLSGIAEETFFRGALQTTVGLIPASLAFGLAHFVPRHPFWNWSLYAAFAGFLLGCLFELTHQLLPVMVAHGLTNFVLIVVLNRRHALEATN